MTAIAKQSFGSPSKGHKGYFPASGVLYLCITFLGITLSIGCDAWRSEPTAHLNEVEMVGEGSDGSVLIRDLGIVQPGQRKKCRFDIHNTTSSNWRVRRVRKSCGCVITTQIPKEIAASQTASIVLELLPTGPEGNVVRTVTIDYSDRPPLRLEIRAVVRSPMSLVQEHFDTGDIPFGGSGSASIPILNYGDTEWASLEVTPAHPWVSVSISRIPSGELSRVSQSEILPIEGYMASVTIVPPHDLTGEFEEFLAIRNGEGQRSGTRTIVVRGRHLHPIATSPVVLILPRPTSADGNGTARVTLTRRVSSAEPIPADSAETPLPLASSFQTNGNGTLDLVVTYSVKPHIANGNINIHFDNGWPPLRIPVISSAR